MRGTASVAVSLSPDLDSTIAAGECTCEDVEHAGRHPGLHRQLSQAQGGEGGILRHLRGEEKRGEGGVQDTDQTQTSRLQAERPGVRRLEAVHATHSLTAWSWARRAAPALLALSTMVQPAA